MAKLADRMDKIADGVVQGYQKIENGVVGSFQKISDKFVGTFLTREGESLEDAKARLAQEQADRETAAKEGTQKRQAEQKANIQASVEASKNAGKRN